MTAVCGTKNVELVRSLGADVVIDYQREDFRKSGEKYDVIVDAVGKIVGLRYRGSLVPGGMFVLTDGLWNVLGVLLTRWSSRRIVARVAAVRRRISSSSSGCSRPASTAR